MHDKQIRINIPGKTQTSFFAILDAKIFHLAKKTLYLNVGNFHLKKIMRRSRASDFCLNDVKFQLGTLQKNLDFCLKTLKTVKITKNSELFE